MLEPLYSSSQSFFTSCFILIYVILTDFEKKIVVNVPLLVSLPLNEIFCVSFVIHLVDCLNEHLI